jgi:hypothetical protein
MSDADRFLLGFVITIFINLDFFLLELLIDRTIKSSQPVEFKKILLCWIQHVIKSITERILFLTTLSFRTEYNS